MCSHSYKYVIGFNSKSYYYKKTGVLTMKQTVIKSVTALLCVVAVCVCSTLAIGKYTTAMVDVAKLTPAAKASLQATTQRRRRTISQQYRQTTPQLLTQAILQQTQAQAQTQVQPTAVRLQQALHLQAALPAVRQEAQLRIPQNTARLRSSIITTTLSRTQQKQQSSQLQRPRIFLSLLIL